MNPAIRQLLLRGPCNWYVDPAGNDANSGRRPGSAFASFAPLAACGVRAGDIIGLVGGGLWRETLTIPASGVIVKPFGSSLVAPRIYNAVNISSGSWTNVTGNEYKISAGGATGPNTGGATPAITWIDVNGTATSIYKGTSGSLSANQWAIASGELHVNIGRAPVSSDQFEVGNPGYCIAIEKSNVLIRGLNLQYAGQYSIGCNVVSALDNVTVDGCEIAWNSADGMNINLGTGTNIKFLNNNVHDQPGDGSGGGDGFSAHGAATGLVQGNTFARCAKDGADMAGNGNFIFRFNRFSKANFVVGTGSGGTLQFYGNTMDSDPSVTDPGAGTAVYQLLCNAGAASTFDAKIYNNSLNAGTKVATHWRAIGLLGGGTIDIRNNIAEGGYTIGMNVSGVTATEDYNNVHGASTRFSGITAGAHDLNADPLYTDPTNGDFTLGGGSTSIGAGVAITGFTSGSPPNLGNTGAAR